MKRFGLGLCVLAMVGCGDDDTHQGDGGGGGDSGGGGNVTVSSFIFEEGMAGMGPAVAGATVSLLRADFSVLATTTTGADGGYQLSAPAGGKLFLKVAPKGNFGGLVRVQPIPGVSGMLDSAAMPAVAGLAAAATDAGTTYDATKGWVYAGFNPRAGGAGGEGVALSAMHAPAFNLYAGGAVVRTTLAPACGVGGTPGVDCVPAAEQPNVLGFPNVAGSSTSVTPVHPAGGTCTVRNDPAPGAWPVFAGTVTSVNVDCT